MSENKHTPEPWHLCEVENETGRIKHLVPVDSEKMSLLTIVENDQATFAAIYKDEDARRIVACVNRLAQFTTEQIEDFGYDLFAEDRPRLVEAQNEIHLLKKQRDELLAALDVVREAVTRAHAGCAHVASGAHCNEARQLARASIRNLDTALLIIASVK